MDPDATFMRMKEDHLHTGQLKPTYTVQIGTDNQFIVGLSVHQRPGDTLCLIPHLNHLQQQLGRLRDQCTKASYRSISVSPNLLRDQTTSARTVGE